MHVTCICEQHDVSTDTMNATRRAYHSTDKDILEKAFELGKEGSTAVTATLINSQTLIIANVGDSQAVISKKGVAEQLSVDHEPNRVREIIESEGGFVSNIPGDVPHIDGQLAIARVFGDKCLKRDLSSDPNVEIELIDNDIDLIILASDGLWKTNMLHFLGFYLSPRFDRSRFYLVATELLLETPVHKLPFISFNWDQSFLDTLIIRRVCYAFPILSIMFPRRAGVCIVMRYDFYTATILSFEISSFASGKYSKL
ncbi:hypothetical protein KY284_030300 [Solanum tuberosum]|nr:hypothetical protein KY284_030300 [Solanum tuberosum]